MKIQVDPNKIVLLPIDSPKLVLNPDNRNVHPEEQIEALAELIKFHGFRWPIIISNLSGYIAAGEGRLLAARRTGMTHIPCMYQDFASQEHEYAFGISDNAIAHWAHLNMIEIKGDLIKLSDGFNKDMLGIKNLKIELDKPEKMELNYEVHQWIVSAYCVSEAHMQILYEELKSRGIECKLIT